MTETLRRRLLAVVLPPLPSPSRAVCAGLAAIAAERRRRPNPYEGTLSPLSVPGEKHLANVRQLTFGGENAEAYWSADGKKLIFQSTRPPYAATRSSTMDVDVAREDAAPPVDRQGPDDLRVLLPRRQADPLRLDAPRRRRLPAARPTCRRGTSGRSTPTTTSSRANADGIGPEAAHDDAGLRRRGHDLDGRQADRLHVGPRRRPRALRDGRRRRRREAPHEHGRLRRRRVLLATTAQWLVYRASPPTDAEGDRELQGAPRPLARQADELEIRVMRADGSDDRQVTSHGAASFAPFFFRGGHDRILFCLERAPTRRAANFDLWAVNTDGTDLERITFNPTFDGFPMFSPGRQAPRVLLEPPQREGRTRRTSSSPTGSPERQGRRSAGGIAGDCLPRSLAQDPDERQPEGEDHRPDEDAEEAEAPRPPKTPRKTTSVESSPPFCRSASA